MEFTKEPILVVPQAGPMFRIRGKSPTILRQCGLDARRQCCVCPFAMVDCDHFLAKLGNETLVGQYGLAVALCLPTITICRFGLRILQSTDARNEMAFGEYFSFSLISTPVGLGIVGGIIANQHFDSAFVPVVIAVAIWNSLESISDLFAGLFQRYERIDLLTKAYLLQAVLMFVFMLLGFVEPSNSYRGDLRVSHRFANSTLVLRIAGRIETNCRIHLPDIGRILTGGLGGRDCSEIHWPAIRRLLHLGMPLAIVTFLMAYTVSVPRFAIDDVLKDDAKLGIFVALFSLASAQNLLVASVAQSLAAPLAVLFAQQSAGDCYN